ncbi:type I phosphomannose isomerase catalytic subunit [Deinococcus budaensis]|uniref:Phosphohexomutase n=1 Tax=Deinococcus budaensis TaxID=1665626 RepID=A0A7W8LQJ2_9DEIO|nr:type I phosphomannose isomerase catalytic subunit [Deinococcus budaensis]MBB5234814.1 mannose-6-phosphate isomerase [Deinococcus budaensis]
MRDEQAPVVESSARWLPLRLAPVFKERVWGGHRLTSTPEAAPVGEAWLIHEDQEVQEGPARGMTLATLAAEFPNELLGNAVRGSRFPLLIKLLDCQEWLSVQVHPDDEQARRLAGPAENGKTEAWYVLEAAPGAELVAGVQQGVSEQLLREVILAGEVSTLVQRRPINAGDSLLVPAGTIHALGPGLLIYEVQQTSDITYRVYDWDRPVSAGRKLHLAESAEVARPGQALFAPPHPGEKIQEVVQCAYFTLQRLTVEATPLRADTMGERCHCLTVVSGEVRVATATEHAVLRPFETVLLPAALGPYELWGDGEVLRAMP